MDVKYVPIVCYVGEVGEKFYQYAMIEEASRERFIYACKENNSYSTVDFVQRAIIYFGYAPDIIQTDNGSEFNRTQKTKRITHWMCFAVSYTSRIKQFVWQHHGTTARSSAATEMTRNASITICGSTLMRIYSFR